MGKAQLFVVKMRVVLGFVVQRTAAVLFLPQETLSQARAVIWLCDLGLQLLDAAEVQLRIQL